jgi:hypothetical protein
MATANLAVRPAIAPGIVAPNATSLVLLFALAAKPVSAQRLVCHWHRNADGRLILRLGVGHIPRSSILHPTNLQNLSRDEWCICWLIEPRLGVRRGYRPRRRAHTGDFGVPFGTILHNDIHCRRAVVRGRPRGGEDSFLTGSGPICSCTMGKTDLGGSGLRHSHPGEERTGPGRD